ncbi:hypothetical protein FQA39_LY00477 [Lamprigera yunnana]|nr:hypothetical protein FQA39_LY00477 [Lamprigera yunnana]
MFGAYSLKKESVFDGLVVMLFPRTPCLFTHILEVKRKKAQVFKKLPVTRHGTPLGDALKTNGYGTPPRRKIESAAPSEKCPIGFLFKSQASYTRMTAYCAEASPNPPRISTKPHSKNYHCWLKDCCGPPTDYSPSHGRMTLGSCSRQIMENDPAWPVSLTTRNANAVVYSRAPKDDRAA